MASQKVEDNIIREHITSRGGGIEIDCGPMGWDSVKVSAYINYLGGDMFGGIGNSCTHPNLLEEDEGIRDIAREARYILHEKLFGEGPTAGGPYNTYKQLKTRPVSAY